MRLTLYIIWFALWAAWSCFGQKAGEQQLLNSREASNIMPPESSPVASESYYTLKTLELDTVDPATTNYTVLVGTNSGDYNRSFSIGTNRLFTVPNLKEGQTYYITLTSASTINNRWREIVWPWPRTNVVRVFAVELPSGNEVATPLTVINPTAPLKLWRLQISQSDNLSSHQIPE